MVIFIDESGIHKKIGHSTTAVVYVEVARLEKFEKDLKAIEQDLRIRSFHWADERWLISNKFLSSIIELDFTVKVAVFKNPQNVGEMLEVVFRHLITEKNIRSILIDGKKPRWYELRLKKVLRDKGVSVKKLRTVKSDTNLGIQLADALAGLARYHFDNPDAPDAKKWFNKYKKAQKIKFVLTSY